MSNGLVWFVWIGHTETLLQKMVTGAPAGLAAGATCFFRCGFILAVSIQLLKQFLSFGRLFCFPNPVIEGQLARPITPFRLGSQGLCSFVYCVCVDRIR